MSHQEEAVREIVADLDKHIETLEALPIWPGSFAGVEVHEGIKRLKESRFWLKEAGHRGHFDTLTYVTEAKESRHE